MIKLVLKKLFFAACSLFLISINGYCNLDSFRFEVSVLTYSPGDELYSVFGHSAIRVIDNLKATDEVFNYGTFDFDTPGFYSKFIKGKLQYSLSKVPMEYVLRTTEKEKRTLYENKLNLSLQETGELVNKLNINYLPENRTYLYDFFYDNCATRIWDIISSATNQRFKLNDTEYKPVSFSELIAPYLKSKQWAKLGLNSIMGAHAHKTATFNNSFFLPDYLQEAIISAEDQETNHKLSQSSVVLYLPVNIQKKKTTQILDPQFVFSLSLLLFLISGYFVGKDKRGFLILNYLVFTPPVILGLMILFFWMISDHYIYAWNLSLLWANPLWVVFLFPFSAFHIRLRRLSLLFILLAMLFNLLYLQSVPIFLYTLVLFSRIIPFNSKKGLIPNIV